MYLFTIDILVLHPDRLVLYVSTNQYKGKTIYLEYITLYTNWVTVMVLEMSHSIKGTQY